MSLPFAILCPGQGTQHAAMFDMARSAPRAAAALDAWSLDAHLGQPLEQVLANPAFLFSNRMAQPLIVAATLSMWTALKDDMPVPALVAGYSIGELSAWAVAGALSCVNAVRLAALRASLMNGCLEHAPGQALAAVSGLHASILFDVLGRHRFHVAIQTSEDAVIVGGLAANLPQLEHDVASLGGRIQSLPVEVASHTPYMGPAVAPFERALQESGFNAPAVPVMSGVSAMPIRQAGTAPAALAAQVAGSIRWMDCMDACAEAGVKLALELGPGSSLSRMLQARHPGIECRSVADFRSLDGVRRWLTSRMRG